MPVTLRSLQIRQVYGAGKKGPTNLKYDHEKKRVINISCECIPAPIVPPPPPPPPPPVLPPPVTVSYAVSGFYTYLLPILPIGYVWQVNGTLVSGGGGGGGGGGGTIGFSFRPGGGGRSSNSISSISVSAKFPGGAVLTSSVGQGGAGGAGGLFNSPGSNGSPGNSSLLVYSDTSFSSPANDGGTGGITFGTGFLIGTANTDISIGQPGGTIPGSVGGGGNGSTNSGSPGSPGLRGVDGSVSFTATAIPA